MFLYYRIICVVGLVVSGWALGRYEESPTSVFGFAIMLLATLAMFLPVFTSGEKQVPSIPPVSSTLQEQTASENLHNQESALLDALSEPAIILDRNLKIKTSNPSARALLGQLVPEESIDIYLRQPIAIEAVRESLQTNQLVERDVPLSIPIESYFVLRSNPLPNRKNVPGDSIILTLHDVTKLRLADRMRADFVANASHELRTPLATLIGFVETLQGPAANDRSVRNKFLDIMSREAARMARLIDDLLSLSRIEMDKHLRPQTQLDVIAIIREVSSALAMQLDADSRFINWQLPDTLPPVIGERDQIIQVFHNLVSNALKYGRKGTAISLEASLEGSHLRLAVEDFGDGIPFEHIPRLTERFYRVDTARSRDLGGTGLGLAIVKHIVERHRGELNITSVLGKGTRVAFTLPIAPKIEVEQIQPGNLL
jgi:two-component system, OmpR family, phosphate regulon sensor histidine kinase PhoR